MWEAVHGYGEPLLHDDALRAYGIIRPAHTHKALNYRLQGSAADLMKKAMADAYYAGVFDVVGVPHITVHDELGFSDEDTHESRDGFKELQHIMQTCIPLSVPVLVDASRGVNWGDAK
jgi:DNA polymerase I-like protein with 3'-5' exonuclease and polymerase domains